MTADADLDIEEYERIAEIALRRVSELGLNQDEAALLLGERSRNSAGSTEDMNWDEVRGTVAAATWTRSAIMEFLRDAADPGITEADRRAADYESCRSQSGVK